MTEHRQDPPTETDQETISQILTIVAEETAIDPDRLQIEARIDELGIASIDLMQTIFALEAHFDIEIPVVSRDAGPEFVTVGDLVAHVMGSIQTARRGASK
jgi:acyl carrier protein